MIQGLTYAILTYRDLPAARRFFTERLGLATEQDQGNVFSEFTTREGTKWGIMQARPDAPSPGVELYLQVVDADESYRTWRARGVEMVTEPHDEPFGRTFALRDPDGRVLHVIQQPSQMKHPGGRGRRSPAIGEKTRQVAALRHGDRHRGRRERWGRRRAFDSHRRRSGNVRRPALGAAPAPPIRGASAASAAASTTSASSIKLSRVTGTSIVGGTPRPSIKTSPLARSSPSEA